MILVLGSDGNTLVIYGRGVTREEALAAARDEVAPHGDLSGAVT